jgi:hypothetical protein
MFSQKIIKQCFIYFSVCFLNKQNLGIGILTQFPFCRYFLSSNCHYLTCEQIRIITKLKRKRKFKGVSPIGLGSTHPRRTKLQLGTFLHFGHPQLIKISQILGLLATNTKITSMGSSTVCFQNRFYA